MAAETSPDGDTTVGARRRWVTTLLAAVAGTLVLSGAAYAWITGAASGTASASTSTMSAVTVVALNGSDATTSDLQPGGTADVVLRVSNPNSFAAELVGVAANGTVTATGGRGTCVTTGVSLVPQSGLSVALARGATTLVDLPGAASMSAAASSGCQGATFAIPVAITVHTP
jgi:hypothetical protein